jgi:ketosteroid isomerase-like protein
MATQLTTNDAAALIAKIYAADEAMDASAFVALLSPEVSFQLGGSPSIRGREAVQEFVQGLFSSLKDIRHQLLHFWLDDRKLVFQGEVTFTFPTGQSMVLPYVDVVTAGKDGLLEDYRIYIDLTPMNAGTNPQK